MIAKSDLIILVVSSTLLGVAVYRWDQNTRNVDTSTVLANTRVSSQTAATDTSSVATTSSSATLADQTLDAPINGTVSESVNEQVSVDTPTTVVVTEPLVVEPARPFLIHVVRSGDSLSEIAASYNTSVQELRNANGINGSTIFIGQEILYPAN